MILPLILLAVSPDAVYLQHSVSIQYSSADSSYTEITRERIVPLNSRGVSRYKEVTASYRNTWESLSVTASISHWRSGRGEDAADVRDNPNRSLLPDGRMESTFREVSVSFPGIEAGDTLNIEIVREIERMPMGDFYSYSFHFASRDSIASASMQLLWPKDRQLIVTSRGEIDHRETLQPDGRVLHVWTSRPQSPSPDIPFSVSIANRGPRVSLSSHAPFQVSRGLYDFLVRNTLERHNTELSSYEGRDSLPPGIPERPVDICRWIADEVQFISGNWGTDPGYSPRTPAETLKEMSGVCRDRALLLLWLLERYGFHADAVLTSYSRDIPDNPGSRDFDHMLVRLHREDGSMEFLDPTNPFSADGYSYYLRGSPYLALTPEGEDIGRFPESCTGDTLAMSIAGNIDFSRGELQGTLSVSAMGSARELFDSMISRVPNSTRYSLLQRMFGFTPPPGDSSFSLDLTEDGRLRIQLKGVWECRWLMDLDRGFMFLPSLTDMDVVASRALALILPEFRSEVRIETPYVLHLSISMTGLPVHGALLPADVSSEYYSLSYSCREDTLIMDEVLRLMPFEPTAGQLTIMRRDLLRCISSQDRMVVFP